MEVAGDTSIGSSRASKAELPHQEKGLSASGHGSVLLSRARGVAQIGMRSYSHIKQHGAGTGKWRLQRMKRHAAEYAKMWFRNVFYIGKHMASLFGVKDTKRLELLIPPS